MFSGLAGVIEEFGEYRILDTVSFLYGMELGEERMFDIEEGKTLVVKLLAIGELQDDGSRIVYFELNGQPREVVVIDSNAEAATERRPKADRSVPGQVAASMQGKVLVVNVKAGDTVEKGEVLLATEAMKMETSVTAPIAGTVARVDVSVGDAVDAGDLVVVIEE